MKALELIHQAEKWNIGFSLYNTKHFETGLIEYEATFYDPWGGPACTQYKSVDTDEFRAIEQAFIKMMEDR